MSKRIGESKSVVKEGLHIGQVLEVANGVVMQKVGRDPDKVVRHDCAMLSRVPDVGEVVDVQYRAGQGVVSGIGEAVALGR